MIKKVSYIALLLFVLYTQANCQSVYNPSLHLTVGKPFGAYGNNSIDARSEYYVDTSYTYRPYVDTSEVNHYLQPDMIREGMFKIFVSSGDSTLIWWYRNGTADSDLTRYDPSGDLHYLKSKADLLFLPYSDTSFMLSPYTKKGSNISQFSNDVGYYKPSDTTSTLGTKYYINSQGFLKSYTETDPIWNAAINANTTITGNWTFNNGIFFPNVNIGYIKSTSGFNVLGVSNTNGDIFLGYNVSIDAANNISQPIPSQESTIMDFNSTGSVYIKSAPPNSPAAPYGTFFTKAELVATQPWVQSQNFIKTETDPVWTAAISSNTNITGNWWLKGWQTIGDLNIGNSFLNSDYGTVANDTLNIYTNIDSTFNFNPSVSFTIDNYGYPTYSVNKVYGSIYINYQFYANSVYATNLSSLAYYKINGKIVIRAIIPYVNDFTNVRLTALSHVAPTNFTAKVDSITYGGNIPPNATYITYPIIHIIATQDWVQSQNYLTANQPITLSGDVTGSGTTSITTTLKNTGTAGTYTRATFDAQGRETSGTDTAYLPLSSFGNYKLENDSTAIIGYSTIGGMNDTLSKINGTNGWLYNTTTRTGQIDSSKYSTLIALKDTSSAIRTTLSGIQTPTLQSVTNNGNTTTLGINANYFNANSTDSLILSRSSAPLMSVISHNLSLGLGSGKVNNSSGAYGGNTYIGWEAGQNTSPGISTNNTIVGSNAGSNLIGSQNTVIGSSNIVFGDGNYITSLGYYNYAQMNMSSNTTHAIAIGSIVNFGKTGDSGEYDSTIAIGDNSESNYQSAVIGYGASAHDSSIVIGNRSSADTGTIIIGIGSYRGVNASSLGSNQIVIGNGVTGNGLNTTTIGNSSNTDNYFNGNIHATKNIIADSIQTIGGSSNQLVTGNGGLLTIDSVVDNNVYRYSLLNVNLSSVDSLLFFMTKSNKGRFIITEIYVEATTSNVSSPTISIGDNAPSYNSIVSSFNALPSSPYQISKLNVLTSIKSNDTVFIKVISGGANVYSFFVTGFYEQ